MTEPALIIRLYLDEDVSVFLAQLLRPHGFEVLLHATADRGPMHSEVAPTRCSARPWN